MKNTTAVPTPSSERSKPQEKSRWEYNPFHCSWERHLYRMKSALAAPLYSWGRGVSFKTDDFHAAIDNIAKHFGCNRKTVMAALEEMVECGWAEVIHSEPGKPVSYRFIDHEEWAREHPGGCIVKDAMPWEEEAGDDLAPRLHSVGHGLVKFYAGQMKGLRKSGLSDDQIVTEFRIFLASNPQQGKGWKTVYYRFRDHLLGVADDLRDAANAANSSSGESAGADTYQSAGADTPSPVERTPTSPLERTQVLEVSSDAATMLRLDTRPASQERSASQPAQPEKLVGGGCTPSTPAKGKSPDSEEKEYSAAPAERKASYEGQLAKVEKLIAENKSDKKKLKGYRELKVIFERKIAEYSKEAVTA